MVSPFLYIKKETYLLSSIIPFQSKCFSLSSFLMAAIDESTVRTIHRQIVHLLPLSPRVPSSTDRHFEQYLIDHHRYSKLPSISKQSIHHSLIENKDFLYSQQQQQQQILPNDSEHHSDSINRLLNSEQYLRSHARLIEYRQHSKIPGVALKPTATTATTTMNNFNEFTSNGRNELILPLKEVFIETTRTKQYQNNQDEIDFVDDDSIFSDETDRRRRAKHWIKEHQFFFTEYQ